MEMPLKKNYRVEIDNKELITKRMMLLYLPNYRDELDCQMVSDMVTRMSGEVPECLLCLMAWTVN